MNEVSWLILIWVELSALVDHTTEASGVRLVAGWTLRTVLSALVFGSFLYNAWHGK